jgi:hypothetical protein
MGAADQVTSAQITAVMQNLDLATCVNILNASGYKPKFILEHECFECEGSNVNVQKNAYGEYLCTDCWVDYLTTERGLVEYYIGIADGTYSKESFSAADLSKIEAAWSSNCNTLKELKTEDWVSYVANRYLEIPITSSDISDRDPVTGPA